MPHWNQPPPDDGPPLGISKGRGFAPAGRGRGIAKWSTSEDNGMPSSGNSLPEVGRRDRDEYHHPPPSHHHNNHHRDREANNSRYNHNHTEPNHHRQNSSRHNHDNSDRYRHQDGGQGSAGQRNGARNNFAGPPRHGKSRDNVECYRCDGIGHLSYECPSRAHIKETRKSYTRNDTSEYFEDADSDPSQGSIDSGRGSKHSNHSFKQNSEKTGHHSNDRGHGGARPNNDHRSGEGDRERRGGSGTGRVDNDRRRGDSDGYDRFCCYSCGQEGHKSRDCQNINKKPSRSHHGGRPGHIIKECFTCGSPDHEQRDCNHNDNHRASTKKQHNHNKNSKEPTEEELFENNVPTGINFSRFEHIDVNLSGDGAVSKIESFHESCLNSVILNNVKKCGYSQPTPVQKHAIPNILNGRDLMACSQTGSGKTAAFLLPVIHTLLEKGVKPSAAVKGEPQTPDVIVVVPTRELAIQIKDEAKKYSVGTGLKSVVIYGGIGYEDQRNKIREGCNILIATPGRLLDFIEKNLLSPAKVTCLVLDEADRMLEQGFHESILKLVRHPDMPATLNRQTLMFSATFPDSIQRLASEFMNNYLFLSVGILGGASSDVAQTLLQVSQFDKREKITELLQNLFDMDKNSKTLVFVQMKKTADFLASYLCQSDLPTTSIHGDRLQEEREEALHDFKVGSKPILVATAVAARGIDIKNVELVVNYDLPKSVEEYVHRIGRTGRVGNTGRAISFYDSCTDGPIAMDLYKVLLDAQQTVPDWLVVESRRNPGPGSGGGRSQQSADKDVREREVTSNWS